MKKVYLRSYSAYNNVPDSLKNASMLNIAVQKCAEELVAQGINVEILEQGDTRLILNDINTIPMYRSSLYRWYYSMKIKVNRFIMKLKK